MLIHCQKVASKLLKIRLETQPSIIDDRLLRWLEDREPLQQVSFIHVKCLSCFKAFDAQ